MSILGFGFEVAGASRKWHIKPRAVRRKKTDTGVLPASNTHLPTFFLFVGENELYVAVAAATAAQPSTLQVPDADAACAFLWAV